MSIFNVVCLAYAGKQERCCGCSGAVLNDQDGFDPNDSEWICSECGPENTDYEID